MTQRSEHERIHEAAAKKLNDARLLHVFSSTVNQMAEAAEILRDHYAPLAAKAAMADELAAALKMVKKDLDEYNWKWHDPAGSADPIVAALATYSQAATEKGNQP